MKKNCILRIALVFVVIVSISVVYFKVNQKEINNRKESNFCEKYYLGYSYNNPKEAKIKSHFFLKKKTIQDYI